MRKVNKADYGVFQSLGGYYFIAPNDKPHPAYAVAGGDPAFEDFYDYDVVKSIYDDWDGSLNDDGKIEF